MPDTKLFLIALAAALFPVSLCAQQPGVRPVSGGGYTFSAEAYRSDMERTNNRSSSSPSTYSSEGFRSLRELRAERKIVREEVKRNSENYLRIRQLDSMKTQMQKTILFYKNISARSLIDLDKELLHSPAPSPWKSWSR